MTELQEKMGLHVIKLTTFRWFLRELPRVQLDARRSDGHFETASCARAQEMN